MRPIFSVGRHTTANNPPPADHTAEDWRELEHRCRDVVSRQSHRPRNRDLAHHYSLPGVQDLYTLFFGPRKHIQDLWDIIDRQRLHIERLEQQLGTSRHTKQPRTNRTAPGKIPQQHAGVNKYSLPIYWYSYRPTALLVWRKRANTSCSRFKVSCKTACLVQSSLRPFPCKAVYLNMRSKCCSTLGSTLANQMSHSTRCFLRPIRQAYGSFFTE